MEIIKKDPINEFFIKDKKYSKKMIVYLQRMLKIMSSSKGRDKMCGIVQYIAKMIALTAKDSNIEHIKLSFKREEMKIHLIAY